MAQRKARVIPWRRRQIVVNNYYDEYCKIEYEGELYHSKEEVDAAIALLMLHYQDFQNVIPNKKKNLSPKADNNAIIPHCSRNPPNENQNEQQDLPSTSKNCEHSKRKSRNEEQEVNRNNNNSNRINRSNNKRKERTSLLTSCRNILKEFLEQNGFQ